jgi:hypothetical protein
MTLPDPTYRLQAEVSTVHLRAPASDETRQPYKAGTSLSHPWGRSTLDRWGSAWPALLRSRGSDSPAQLPAGSIRSLKSARRPRAASRLGASLAPPLCICVTARRARANTEVVESCRSGRCSPLSPSRPATPLTASAARSKLRSAAALAGIRSRQMQPGGEPARTRTNSTRSLRVPEPASLPRMPRGYDPQGNGFGPNPGCSRTLRSLLRAARSPA